MDVVRAYDLVAQGQSPMGLVRQAGRGQLVRVRHGAYTDALAAGDLEQHRQLIAGTWPILGQDAVISHTSAGVLHGLPTWASMLGRVTVIRTGPGHGGRRTYLHARSARLEQLELTTVDGYRVTTLERTALDLACILSHERAVAVLDAALHLGGSRDVLTDLLTRAQGRHGVGTARAALALADGRSESVAESISRVRMRRLRLPAPELQVNVFDEHGTWVARSDFGWLEHGVLGEFDGRVKYLGTESEVATTVVREKAREARMRELGWVVVRWGWADLADLDAFRRRIEYAFAQANPASLRGFAHPS